MGKDVPITTKRTFEVIIVTDNLAHTHTHGEISRGLTRTISNTSATIFPFFLDRRISNEEFLLTVGESFYDGRT